MTKKIGATAVLISTFALGSLLVVPNVSQAEDYYVATDEYQQKIYVVSETIDNKDYWRRMCVVKLVAPNGKLLGKNKFIFMMNKQDVWFFRQEKSTTWFPLNRYYPEELAIFHFMDK